MQMQIKIKKEMIFKNYRSLAEFAEKNNINKAVLYSLFKKNTVSFNRNSKSFEVFKQLEEKGYAAIE